MYNRYQGNTGRFRRVEDAPPEPVPGPPPEPPPSSAWGPPPEDRPEPPRRPPPGPPPLREASGGELGSLLRRLIPEKLETEDLLVLAMLFLLYRESGDTEFLLTLGLYLIL